MDGDGYRTPLFDCVIHDGLVVWLLVSGEDPNLLLYSSRHRSQLQIEEVVVALW